MLIVIGYNIMHNQSFDGSASLAAETCLWMQDEEEKEHKRKIPKEESSDKSYYLNGKKLPSSPKKVLAQIG